MGVDYWDRERWADAFATSDVMVMTAQVFLDLLNHAHWGIDKVSSTPCVSMLMLTNKRADITCYLRRSASLQQKPRICANYEDSLPPLRTCESASRIWNDCKSHI